MLPKLPPRKIIIADYLPYAVLILAVLAAYANVYRNDFLFDDELLITGNKFLTSWRHIGDLFVTSAMQGYGFQNHDAFYRPLQLLLYMAVFQTAGASTAAFHLLNITLHAANACLLCALGIRLGFARGAAFGAALLWAVHPVETEAVTYMSGSADLLCGLFLIAGIFVLTHGFTRGRILAACALHVLALLSKETAIMFPLLAMGLVFYQSPDRWPVKNYLKTWPFWVVTGIYILMRETVLNFDGFIAAYDDTPIAAAGIAARIYTFLATLPMYAGFLVWPVDLHMDRSMTITRSLWEPQVLAGLGILAAFIIGVVWKPRQRATPLAWGIVWAGALHAPQANLLTTVHSPICEHWLYLPMMGLALGIGESVVRAFRDSRVPQLRLVLPVFTASVAALCGVLTFQQNRIWRDPYVFFGHIAEYRSDSPRVFYNLGRAYEKDGQYQLAIREYLSDLTIMDDSETRYRLGTIFVNLYHDDPRMREEGLKQFRRALELDPDFFQAADALAHVYNYTGDHEKEAQYLALAASIRKKLGVD